METENQINESEKNEESNKKLVKFSFLIFGIAGLLAWNTILSAMDFFSACITSYDPSFIFPFFNFALNIVFQFILIFRKQLFTYKNQLIFSLVFSGILLIVLPLSVSALKDKQTINAVLTSIMILFQGLLNAVCQSSFFGLVSFFPIDIIVVMSSGQGIVGILMNVIQYILTFIFQENENYNTQAIIFFSIAFLIIVISLIFLFLVYKNDYFKKQLILTEEYNKNTSDSINTLVTAELKEEEDNNNTNTNKEISFLELTKLLLDLNILTVVLYIITFSVFPGVCLGFQLYNLDKFKTITIITIYNVSDTLGRMLVSSFNPTKTITYIVILSRISLLIIMPIDFYYQNNSNLFITSTIFALCVIFCGVTNGIGTSLVFALAPSLVPDHIKGRAGSSISFYLIVGIFLGTLGGMGMGEIIKIIQKKK